MINFPVLYHSPILGLRQSSTLEIWLKKIVHQRSTLNIKYFFTDIMGPCLDILSHYIIQYLTERKTEYICSGCVKLISWASIGTQEIYFTQNNHNEFNFMETLMIILEAQENQSNKPKSEEFAHPTFFRDALYNLTIS
jgi:hypothetical protein